MKNVRTRLKKAFSVHGTMKTPSREATLIIDTLRKPKPHTAEREETRARHYRGSRRGETGRTPKPQIRAGGKGWLRVYAPAVPECLSLCSGRFNCDTNHHFCCRAGGNEATRLLGRGFPKPTPASQHGKSQRCAQGSRSKTLGIIRTWMSGILFSIRWWLQVSEATPSHPWGLTARSPSSSYPRELCCRHSSDLRHVQSGEKTRCEPTTQTTRRKTRQESQLL